MFKFNAGSLPVQAKGRLVDGLMGKRFAVLEGSTAVYQKAPGINTERSLQNRQSLIATGVLILDPRLQLYRFTQDYIFSSASMATGVILGGGNASGPGKWFRETDKKSMAQIRAEISARLKCQI